MQPTFGLPALSIWQAIGIGIVWSALSYIASAKEIRYVFDSNDDKETVLLWNVLTSMFNSLLNPFMFLVTGFIVHLCM